MTTTAEIYQLCKELNIFITHTALPASIRGFYTSDGVTCDIVINNSLTMGEPLYRSVLAEELGHYFTSVGKHVPKKIMTYTNRINYDRCEYRALKWASNYLIKTHSLLYALKHGYINEFSDIGAYFQVTSDIVKQKLRAMANERLTWHLDSERQLVLSNLPNVWIYSEAD